jgi:hypothetical protein
MIYKCEDCNKLMLEAMKCFVCKKYLCDDCWLNNNHGRYDGDYNECLKNEVIKIE